MKFIYLDNASTTQVYPEVAEVMNEVMLKEYGNPSSPHAFGEEALKLVVKAKTALSSELNAKPSEIIFTSGASEANNLALFGLAEAYPQKKKIIVSALEHASIYEPCMVLKKQGYDIIEIPIDCEGLLDMKRLGEEIDEQVLVVSVIHGHNEIGVLQNIEAIARLCKQKDVFFHTDAVQSFGKTKIDVRWGVDLLSASAHKIHGPKGIGFLYVRPGIKIEPLLYGGGQERVVRGGTENVPGIVGFARALELMKKRNIGNKIIKMRDFFMQELEKLGGKINGSRKQRLYNHIHVSFLGIEAEQLVIALSEEGVMCSARSACLTKQKSENRILKALGLSNKQIQGSIRFVLSEYTTIQELSSVVKVLRKDLSNLGL
ncbi:cysteine desulfurase [Candidatus Pacearchaeota archaeon]|nr:cysteine desulfurase [Candidatus Pacearchaeota archaeon]